MADQFYVELSVDPVAETARYALWVLTREQLHKMLSTSHYKKWSLAASSKRDPQRESFHPTARARTAIPAPVSRFLGSPNDERTEPGRVLYHGCGRDVYGMAAMTRSGRDEVEGYDPYHPDAELRSLPKGKFDEVFSIYTLNVVPVGTGTEILCELVNSLKKGGRAVIAVRRDL